LNIEDPEQLAKALSPLLDNFERRLLNSVHEEVQSGLDRFSGAVIQTPVGDIKLTLAPRAQKTEG